MHSGDFSFEIKRLKRVKTTISRELRKYAFVLDKAYEK